MSRPEPQKIVPAGGDTAKPINLTKRLDLIQRFAGLRGQRALDCGCGAGEYVMAMLDEGADAWGIEYLADKVAAFRDKFPGSDRVSVGDLEAIKLPADSFDVALLNEVLEHVPDDLAALREVYRVLRPGGRLVVFSPNRIYPFETHGVTWKGSPRRVPHYVPFIPYVPLPLGRRFFDYWARNYWPGQLRHLVKAAGFQITHVSYLWQTFENISGRQPAWMRRWLPLLRSTSNRMEKIPLVRAFGTSQVIIAQK